MEGSCVFARKALFHGSPENYVCQKYLRHSQCPDQAVFVPICDHPRREDGLATLPITQCMIGQTLGPGDPRSLDSIIHAIATEVAGGTDGRSHTIVFLFSSSPFAISAPTASTRVAHLKQQSLAIHTYINSPPCLFGITSSTTTSTELPCRRSGGKLKDDTT